MTVGGSAPSAGIVLAETVAKEASSGRARSARDLFAALSDSTDAQLAEFTYPSASSSSTAQERTGKALQSAEEAGQPRVISVRDFQRGTSVVKPAQPLPFPG